MPRPYSTAWPTRFGAPEHYIETVRTKEMQTPLGKRGLPLSPRLVTITKQFPRTRPRGLNSASNLQMLAFFNKALGLPEEHEIRKTPQGHIKTPTANDNALRKWAKFKMRGPGISPRDRTVAPVTFAQPFVSLILTLRDLDKQLAVLRTPLDPDGRMRCSYNVAGTENARWSSSKNAFGRGSNLQNVSDTMRRMFVADDGYVLVSTDLEQAESRDVAAEVWRTTGDRAYLDACLSGDLHTQVCMMAWPELGWISSDPNDKTNRAIAEQKYPNLGGLTYRDVAKRIGHGSNYRGSAFGISQAVGIPSYIVEEFQHRYFAAFPAIREWHLWVQTELRTLQYLDTPLFRRRIFFGRPHEDKTLREAIAFAPQSTVGELLNFIMYRVWRRTLLPKSDPEHLPIQLLLQNHDAFLFQVRETEPLPSIIERVNAEFNRATIPFVRPTGEVLDLLIPGEFVTGWNWAKEDLDGKEFEDKNPDGLRKWRGAESRRRSQKAVVSASDWLGSIMPQLF